MRTRLLILQAVALALLGCSGGGKAGTGIGETLDVDILDTLKCSAAGTSFTGIWLLRDSSLFFVDKYVVGVKEYGLDGRFIASHITRGRASDEMVSPAWTACFDSSDGSFIAMDSGSRFHRYTRDWVKVSSTDMPWYQSDPSFTDVRWQMLYDHPDPEVMEMYEYNFDCRRMVSIGGSLFLPIRTEHVDFNAYSRGSGRREYWRRSHTVLEYNDSSMTLLGHYPEFYTGRRNIPVFATYDISDYNGSLAVSYAADHSIYMLGEDGNVSDTFGVADTGVSLSFPSTYSFNEYEEKFKQQREKYGHYERIVSSGDTLLRSLRRDNGTMAAQVYVNRVYCGTFTLGQDFEIIGECSGTWYASMEPDYEKELMPVIAFRIDLQSPAPGNINKD